MKKGKKKYIIFISIVIVYLLGMYIWYLKDKKDIVYLVVRNDVVWQYHRKKWSSYSGNFENLNWTKFNVYSDGEKIGKYDLWYSEQWYVFDDNNKAIIYDGELFAYQSPNNVKALSFKSENVSDYRYVEAVLNKNHISMNNNYMVSNVISKDIDSDGKKEKIYLVSNAFSELPTDKYYTFVFMVKNNKVYTMYKKIVNDYYDGCLPYIDGIIDADNNSKYELVFTCVKYSMKDPINKIYEFKNDKFRELISN